jgi:hypothetical protein
VSKPLHVIGAIAVAFLSLARTSDVWAGCSPSDFADALVNTVGDGASFLKNHAKCAPHFSDPAFWTISSGVTLLATSSSDVKNTCHDIENLDASAGGTQQKIESIYHQLPSDAQNAINKIAGVDDINSSSADLAAVLSFLSCACALANESGAPQVTQVLGNCLTSIMCWADDVLFDNPCVATPPPKLVDCANAYDTYDGGIFNSWNDATGSVQCSGGVCYHITEQDGPVSEYCYCPSPMVVHSHLGSYLYTSCDCPPNTHRADRGHIDHNNPILARTCLCDSTNELVNADGSCPPPCSCGCKNNQIVLAKDTNNCTCSCGCPNGQILVDDKCVTPCAGTNQVLLANGACCSPEQVTSCGTCCPFNTKPDPVIGSCVYAPMPPPPEKAVSHPPNSP